MPASPNNGVRFRVEVLREAGVPSMIGFDSFSPLHGRIGRGAALLRSSLQQPISLDPSRRVDIMGRSTPILRSGGADLNLDCSIPDRFTAADRSHGDDLRQERRGLCQDIHLDQEAERRAGARNPVEPGSPRLCTVVGGPVLCGVCDPVRHPVSDTVRHTQGCCRQRDRRAVRRHRCQQARADEYRRQNLRSGSWC